MLAVGYLLIVADILFFYVSLVESRPGKHLTLNYGVIITTAVLKWVCRWTSIFLKQVSSMRGEEPRIPRMIGTRNPDEEYFLFCAVLL